VRFRRLFWGGTLAPWFGKRKLSREEYLAARSQTGALEAHFFREHSRAELSDWARRLRHFRFCRAAEGLAEAGDRLRLSLAYKDGRDLLRLLATLRIPARFAASEEPQIGSGTAAALSHSGSDPAVADFPKARILGRPPWIQPGSAQCLEVRCFVWIEDQLTLALSGTSGDGAGVTESDVAAAELLESRLGTTAGRVLDPPEEGRHCLCPQNYPGVWQGLGFRPEEFGVWDLALFARSARRNPGFGKTDGALPNFLFIAKGCLTAGATGCSGGRERLRGSRGGMPAAAPTG